MIPKRRAKGLKERAKCPEDCLHRDQEGNCLFCYRSGVSRGCDPGPYCDRYLPAEGARKAPVPVVLPPEPEPVARPYRRPTARDCLEHDPKALRLYAAGATDPEIARATGWSVSSVRRWRRETGRESTRTFASIEDRAAEAEALYSDGASDMTIARALGCSVTGIYQWRLRTGRKANFPRGRPYTDKK